MRAELVDQADMSPAEFLARTWLDTQMLAHPTLPLARQVTWRPTPLNTLGVLLPSPVSVEIWAAELELTEPQWSPVGVDVDVDVWACWRVLNTRRRLSAGLLTADVDLFYVDRRFARPERER